MVSMRTLKNLAVKVDRILKDELGKNNISYNMAEARVWDSQSVGVVGDERAYAYVAEITLYEKSKFVWDKRFIQKLSTRITNEVKNVGRVVYLIAKK